MALLKFFTVLTSLGAKERLALSFRHMNDDPQNHIRVIPPLLRREVTLHEPYSGDYIHGSMVNAGFSENEMKWYRQHSGIPLRFSSDKWEEEPVKRVDNTLSFHQLDVVEFSTQMAGW